MKFAMQKYYPLIIRTCIFLVSMSIIFQIIIYATDFISTHQGAVIFELGKVFISHGIVVLIIIAYFQKYAIYAISTYSLMLYLLFTKLCTSGETLVIDEWSMGLVGAIFNLSFCIPHMFHMNSISFILGTIYFTISVYI